MPNALARLAQLQAAATAACAAGSHTMEVEVIVWPMEGNVGHVALRLGPFTLGYYPTDLNNDGAYGKDDLHDSPAELHVLTIAESKRAYKNDKIFVFPLKIGCEILLCLIAWYIALLGKLGTYRLLSRNCTTIVADALNHCGLDMTATADFPASELGNLQLTTPGKITVLKQGVCTNTLQFDHKSVVSPNQMKSRLEKKPFVTGMKTEVV